MQIPNRRRAMAAAALLATLAAAGTMAVSARADEDPWAPGTQWMTVRAGFAKSGAKQAGNGGAGFGFGYCRMLSSVKIYRWTLLGKGYSLGGQVHYELIGVLGPAAEIEVPATVELLRHFRWGAALGAYLGLGGGAYYHKTYRTGDDVRGGDPGFYVAFGANTPIAERNLLGLDLRFSRVSAVYDPPNPVFGIGTGKLKDNPADPTHPSIEKRAGIHWSAKVSYSLAY